MKSYACGSTVGFASGDGGSSGAGTTNVHVHIKMSTSCHVPHPSSRSAVHGSPCGFLQNDLQVTQANTSYPPGVRLTKRLVSPQAATDPSVRERGCPHFVGNGSIAKTDSPKTHKADAYRAPNRYKNGVLPSGVTVNLLSTNPAQRTANETAGDVADCCKQVFVSICVQVSTVQVLVCVRVLLRTKPLLLVTRLWGET